MITAKAFAGKHYAVYGLARSGLATAEALLASGAKVTAWDAKEEAREQLRSSLAESRGGGPSKGWWREPTVEVVERRAPSTNPLRVSVPLPVPGRSLSRASSFESHAVTRAPLASSASTVASPDRARP